MGKEEQLRKRIESPVNAGSFLSIKTPVSRVFGLDRGTAIDRIYIEKFLFSEASHLNPDTRQIRLLEVGGTEYSRKIALDMKWSDAQCEILDFSKGTDLRNTETLKKDCYDLFICTQTFNFIYEVKKAIEGAYYTLKPGGTLLATVAGAITPISRYDMDRWGHFWGFTDLSARKLFSEVFGEDNVEVSVYGNVLAATAFVQGVALEDLEDVSLLDEVDEDYQMILGIKATKR